MFGFHHLEARIAEGLGDDEADQLFVLSNEDQDLVRHACSLRKETETAGKASGCLSDFATRRP